MTILFVEEDHVDTDTRRCVANPSHKPREPFLELLNKRLKSTVSTAERRTSPGALPVTFRLRPNRPGVVEEVMDAALGCVRRAGCGE